MGFRVPVGARKRMEAIMRNFFWHGAETDGTRGQALVKWSTVCRPTVEGGLGVRNLKHTNTALLMKWVRRLMQAPSDMATQVLMGSCGRTRHHVGGCFLEIALSGPFPT